MMKFINQYDEDATKVEMTLPADATLGEVLEVFEMFLKASGYAFNGIVEIVEDPNDTIERTN